MPFPPNAPQTETPGLAARHALDLPPFRGITLLLVEDSRFVCDALRMICLRSGGRLKRAESLFAARAYLSCRKPDVVIVDLGLPDGRGEGLIAEVAASGLPVLGMSGDPEGRTSALAAGAAGFLDKPLAGVAAFQRLILGLVGGGGPADPKTGAQPGQAAPPGDPLALRDDLARVAGLIGGSDRGYAAGFLRSLGRAAGDPALELAAADAGSDTGRAALSRLVAERLARLAAMPGQGMP